MKAWLDSLSSFIGKFKLFFQNPIIVFYFFTIVLVGGSFGVWFPFIDYSNSFLCFLTDKTTLFNVSTYTVSILAATMADFLLNNKSERSKTFIIFVFCLFLISVISSFISISRSGLFCSYIGLFLMVLVWIVVYVDDASKAMNDTKSPSGGKNPDEVKLEGTIKGFKI